MPKREYALSYRLSALHSTDSLPAHPHLWEINFNLRHCGMDSSAIEEIEEETSRFFATYESGNLNLIPPFDSVLPTLENLGEIFFQSMKIVAEKKGWRLISLEIYESHFKKYRLKETDDADAPVTGESIGAPPPVNQEIMEEITSVINEEPAYIPPDGAFAEINPSATEGLAFGGEIPIPVDGRATTIEGDGIAALENELMELAREQVLSNEDTSLSESTLVRMRREKSSGKMPVPRYLLTAGIALSFVITLLTALFKVAADPLTMGNGWVYLSPLFLIFFVAMIILRKGFSGKSVITILIVAQCMLVGFVFYAWESWSYEELVDTVTYIESIKKQGAVILGFDRKDLSPELSLDMYVRMNEALEGENFTFIFDRAIESGADVVAISKKGLPDYNGANSGAEKCGFRYVRTDAYTYIFVADTPRHFASVSRYDGLAIGDTAYRFTYRFPCFSYAASRYLDDYPIDRLREYNAIFLSDFKYRNAETALNLVNVLASEGKTILVNAASGSEIFGVKLRNITFEGNYPPLHYNGGLLRLSRAPEMVRATCIEDLSEIEGYSIVGGNKLAFFGSTENPNVKIIGFSLMEYLYKTNDEALSRFIKEQFWLNYDAPPHRVIVSISPDYSGDVLSVETDEFNLTLPALVQDYYEILEGRYEEVHGLISLRSPRVVVTKVSPMVAIYLGGTVLLSVIIWLIVFLIGQRYLS